MGKTKLFKKLAAVLLIAAVLGTPGFCTEVMADDWGPCLDGGDHMWDETVYRKPTCSQKGIMQYTCWLCGEVDYEDIETLDHEPGGTEILKKPTATETGIVGFRCINCGEILYKEVIPCLQKRATPTATFNSSNGVLSNIPGDSTVRIDGTVVSYSASGSVGLSNYMSRSGNYEVHVTANGSGDSSDSDTQILRVYKASAPSGLWVTAAGANTKGVINNVNTGMEYTLAGGSSWTTCSGSSIQVPAGNYWIRVKPTAVGMASDITTVNVPQAQTTAEKTPQAYLDGYRMNVNGVQGCRLSFDGGKTWTATQTGNLYTCSENSVNTAYGIVVYKPGNGSTTTDSARQQIYITKQATPNTLSATSATPTVPGVIAGTDATMQYRPSNQSGWIEIGANRVNVASGTYYVRRKGTTNSLASDAVTVVVGVQATPVTTKLTSSSTAKTTTAKSSSAKSSSSKTADDKKAEEEAKAAEEAKKAEEEAKAAEEAKKAEEAKAAEEAAAAAAASEAESGSLEAQQQAPQQNNKVVVILGVIIAALVVALAAVLILQANYTKKKKNEKK